MKHLKTIILVLIGVILTIVIFGSFPNWWKSRIESYVNDQILDSKGWELHLDSLSGNFLTSVSAWNVKLSDQRGNRISVPIIKVNPSLISFLFGNPRFSNLTVKAADITYLPLRSDSAVFNPATSVRQLLGIRIWVSQFHLDGKLYFPIADSLKETQFSCDGSLRLGKKNSNLRFNSVILNIPDLNLGLNLQSIEGLIEKDSLVLNFDHSRINNQMLIGNISYSWIPENKVVASLSIKDFQLSDKLFSEFPLRPKLSRFNVDVQFQSDLKRISGKTQIDNNLGLHLKGDFFVTGLPEYFHLNNLTLTGDKTTLETKGILERSGRFSGNFRLSNLDLSQWLENQRSSDVSGYLIIEGQARKFKIASLELSGEVDESRLYSDEHALISGSVLYADNKLSTLNPVMLTVGSSSVKIEGSEKFTTDSIDLFLELQDANTFLFSKLIGDTLSNGKATGTMELFGTLDNLDANVNLIIRDFTYKGAFLDYFELNGSLGNLPSLTSGNIKVKFGNGTWRDYGFNGGTGEFFIQGDKIMISGMELKQGKNFFQLSGSVEEKRVLFVDRLQVAYNDHYLINPAPLEFRLTDNGISIQPFELHVDDGVVEGFYNSEPPMSGRLKFSNIPSDLIYIINLPEKYDLSGMAFGEIGLKQAGETPDYNVDLSIKNGEIAQQHFDDFYFSAFYRKEMLHIDELTLTQGSRTGLQLTGSFPLQDGGDRPGKVDLQSSFKNLDLAVLTQFIPNWFKIGGRITGDFNISGSTEKTRYQFNSEISDAQFESIPFGVLRGNGTFDGKNLRFDYLESIRGENKINGSGSLPLNFNLASEQFGKYQPQGEFDFSVHGNFTDFIFLTNYLVDVDSIRGDIEVELELKGPPDKIMRQGSISVSGGRIYTVLIDAPVLNVEAQANIQDNLLTVETFNGSLVNRQKKRKMKQNLHLTGTMDLTRFFEPRFDINLTGEKVYFKSLSGEIEGSADVDLQVIGKDTINITGVIAALDGAYYQDFNSPETIESVSTSSRVITNYNLRFPIKERFAIRNSQIDTEIGGELDMSKIGDKDWDYSGEIQFLNGKIYYYLGGDVFENLKGSMTFDGKGFNPFLDISAMTKIGDAEIRLGVYGPLNNPEWVFDSNQGLSESDILQLLTFHTRISEEGITSEGLGTQAQSVLGAYLERQFEKNFIRLSGLESIGLVEEVSISGTSDLINKQGGEDFTISAKVSDRFSFNYRRSFSLDNPYQNRVGVEYKLNPYFSMVGNVDETGQMHMKLRLRYSY